MREIVGRMRLEEMVSDRQKFADLVKENAEPDLAAMGLDVVSFNVQNFTDSNGVIDDLGIDNISQIKKKAAIAKAEAEKEIAVAKAEADRQSNDARINSEREIAIKNNELDMQISTGMSRSLRQRQRLTSRQMMQESMLSVRLPRRIMSLPFRRQSFRKTRTASGRKQMRHMRSRKRNSERPSK